VDQLELSILVPTTNIQYGFANPNLNTDWYGIRIAAWTSHRIQVTLEIPPSPGQPLEATWVPIGQKLAVASP
jgi:hypothetical protein